MQRTWIGATLQFQAGGFELEIAREGFTASAALGPPHDPKGEPMKVDGSKFPQTC
jgi:hypothetical protein